MLGSLGALPVLLLEVLAELVLLGVALTVVIRAHRTVGLALGAAVALVLLAVVGAPLVEVAVYGYVMRGSPPPAGPSSAATTLWLTAGAVILFANWAPYIARALLLGVMAWALARLVGRLPPEARDDLGGVPPGDDRGDGPVGRT